MLFSLEAVEAKHGDALILHYGTSSSPQFIVIDGGPAGVYRKSLKPRLEEIRDAWTGDDPLPIELLMISHIDDDHLRGVLDMTKELLRQSDRGDTPIYDILALWHNSFDDIIGNTDAALLAGANADAAAASLGGFFPDIAGADRRDVAVIASVNQGRRLRDDAKLLGVPTDNPPFHRSPFHGLVMADETAIDVTGWGSGLELTVIAPIKKRVRELQTFWDKELRKAKRKGDNRVIGAAFEDKSPANLSSIVVLARMRGRSMLLTGDARGDDILKGLRNASMLRNGKIHVNLLKMPHHGSDRNVSTQFFRQVTADHYVISGNGEHHNPDIATLEMISAARSDDDFELHLTNRKGKHGLERTLKRHFAKEKRSGRRYGVNFRGADDRSIVVDLLDAIDY